MKILQLVAYYSPERIASAHLSKDREEAFAAAGFTTELYAPTPTRGLSEEEYKEYKKVKQEKRYDGKLTINRFSMFREGKNPLLRAARYFLVNIGHYIKGTSVKDADVILCGSTPPTQGMLCGLIKKRLSRKAKRNIPFVFILQDIFPDSLVNAKMTKKGSLIWKIGRKIENYAYRSADRIIVISEDFKRNIMEKGVPEERIAVIPNWVNTDKVYPVKRRTTFFLNAIIWIRLCSTSAIVETSGTARTWICCWTAQRRWRRNCPSCALCWWVKAPPGMRWKHGSYRKTLKM